MSYIPDYRDNFRNKLPKGGQADMYLIGYHDAIEDMKNFFIGYPECYVESGSMSQTFDTIKKEIITNTREDFENYADGQEIQVTCDIVEENLPEEAFEDEEMKKIVDSKVSKHWSLK